MHLVLSPHNEGTEARVRRCVPRERQIFGDLNDRRRATISVFVAHPSRRSAQGVGPATGRYVFYNGTTGEVTLMDAFIQSPGTSPPFSGYVYPNETVLPWGRPDRRSTPTSSGLVAGAFIGLEPVSHVRDGTVQTGRAPRPAARRWRSCAFAPAALLSSPGAIRSAPSRRSGLPHWTSAFAAFAYVAGLLRHPADISRSGSPSGVDIVAMAWTTNGALGRIYRVLTLGSDDVSERALAVRPQMDESACGHRHRVGGRPAWLCRLRLRFAEIAGMVVVGPDADHFHPVCHRLRRGGTDAGLRGVLEGAQDGDRRELHAGPGPRPVARS